VSKWGQIPIVSNIRENCALTLFIIELLINKGAEVNARDKEGLTPLDLAIHKGRKRVEQLLRKHGAKEGQSFENVKE